MYSKSLLIAIAAFAVTATGAQAYVGSQYLERAGLSTTQVSALSQARDLRMKGKREEARDVLLQAGVDDKALASIRQAARAAHEAIEEAVEANDFEAFKLAAAESPLSDIITTKEDFAQFVEVHNLKAEKKFVEARELMNELGLPGGKMNQAKGRLMPHDRMSLFTEEQKDALRVARQTNDFKTMQEIMKEAGMDDGRHEMKRMKQMKAPWQG
jgi:hypothetical protein